MRILHITMDAPPPPMDAPPPPPTRSSSYTSIPILAISLLGILTTAILLLSYYLFIINCCFHWRRRRSHLLPFRRRPPAEPLHNPHEVHGLDPAAIRSIPTLRFSSAGKQGAHAECAVCLAELEERELLRVLPGCNHSFHVDCIDTWLQSSPNCPLCRFDVNPAPIHHFSLRPDLEQRDPGGAAVVVGIEVTDGSNAGGTETEVHTPIRTATPKVSKQRKFWQVAGMGDECIDVSRGKDEGFTVQPIRRSFSMDSSNDRPLFLSVQEMLLQQQNREVLRDVCRGEGTSSGGANVGNASGRSRQSFFSFGRSSRSTTAVLTERSELW